jgi:hypothetical protein
LGIEGEKEFNCGAGEKGGEDGVYSAVDMVEREHVKEVVQRGIFPGFDQGLGLCCHYRLRKKNSFLKIC